MFLDFKVFSTFKPKVIRKRIKIFKTGEPYFKKNQKVAQTFKRGYNCVQFEADTRNPSEM